MAEICYSKESPEYNLHLDRFRTQRTLKSLTILDNPWLSDLSEASGNKIILYSINRSHEEKKSPLAQAE